MTDTILTLRDVEPENLRAVLAACSQVREDVRTNLANGPAWAPQVHNSGPRFKVICPPMSLKAAQIVLAAADGQEVPA